MKIGIFTDVHWSTTTSILRSKEGKYTTRLNLLIKGMNWANELFAEKGCKFNICAGDFFDKSSCTDEELSAVKEVVWIQPTLFIVGNHESSRAGLEVSSTKALASDKSVGRLPSNIIEKPTLLETDEYQIYLLPYVVESDRKPLKEYLSFFDPNKKHIIFSHNDLRDVQYGAYLNTTGFSLSEIEEVADLYLNGHIHNGQWITEKILNLGSMTAQNFTNDSNVYKYGVWILDTDTLKLEFFENPYSLNFYKFDINKKKDMEALDTIKSNAILSVKCYEPLKDELKLKLLENSNILLSRITYFNDIVIEDGEECTLVKSDHLEQFKNYILENLGTTNIIKEELNEVCK